MISDFAPGQSVSAECVLRNCELRCSRNEKKWYLHVELGDASGRISGSVWDDAQGLYERCAKGSCVRVHARVINWQGRRHLSVDRLEPIDVPRTGQWIPDAPVDTRLIYERILGLIHSVGSPHLQQVLQNLFETDSFRSDFLAAPAGKLWHHCTSGGLAQHTWAVTELVLDIAKFYPNLQKDLLIAGALLHDVGNITEYTSDRMIEYSDAGRLLGHVSISYSMVAAEIDTLTDFPSRLRAALLHLILSHHGERECGSPIPPMSPEAMVLHLADRLDSLMNAYERIRQRDYKPGQHWSQYVRLLDRFFYFADDDCQTQPEDELH